MYKVL